MNEEPRVVVTTIEDEPGRIHIAMFRGHGVDMVEIRWELSLGQMRDMHTKLTEALYDRLTKP